jgi:ubiquinone/menaquinone biosynthesis C-methylase UbiE
VEFTVGNFLDMPFRDRQFDVVISYRLIAHIANTQQFIKELTRVADKAVILDYPEVRSINYLEPHLFQVKKAIEETVRRYNCFRQADLDEQFHQLGFEPSSRYPQYFLPMALHRKTNNVRLSSALERIFRFVCLTSTFGSPVIYKAVRKEFVTSDQAASQSFRPEPRRSHSR